jgi:subtilisin family serine protease
VSGQGSTEPLSAGELPPLTASTPVAANAAGAPELLVRFRGGVEAEERIASRRAARTAFGERLPLGGAEVVRVLPGESPGAAEAALERDPDVLYAEPNVARHALRIPSDPNFGLLWGLQNTGQVVGGRAGVPDADIDATEAWDVTSGSPSVVVAVVDSGIEPEHPELAPNLWVNAAEAAGRARNDDDGNGYVDDVRGWDFVERDNTPNDPFGHGTHVAGTIGARMDDQRDIVGVAPATRLLALRTLNDQGYGAVDDAIKAYDYAVRAGARVINVSLGGPGGSQTERNVIRAASGVLFVGAAGNGGADRRGRNVDSSPTFPCGYDLPNVICVSASDQTDSLASFADYGVRTVDLVAPGTSIRSTFGEDGYLFADGTSMAAPHVSGAAGLLWARVPAATPVDVRAALLAGVDRLPGLTGRVASGGRLNARTALEAIVPPPPLVAAGAPTAPPAPAAAPPVRPRDTRPPRVSLIAARSQRLAIVRRRGVRARVSCSEACAIPSLSLHLDAPTARRLRRRASALLVGRGSARMSGPGRRLVAIRLTPAGRRALRSLRSVGVILTARVTDPAGNVTVTRVRILLGG